MFVKDLLFYIQLCVMMSTDKLNNSQTFYHLLEIVYNLITGVSGKKEDLARFYDANTIQ